MLAADRTLPTDAHDSTDPTENADPIEPTEKADPMLPIDANDPMLPIESAEPIERRDFHEVLTPRRYRGLVDPLLNDAVTRLTAAGARDELLVDYVRRTWLGVKLAARLVPVERVWRLGVLLLGRSGALYATGTTLRVTEPRHPNAQSRLAEDRRQLRAIALTSGIAGGETINLDARDISLDAATADTRPVVRTGGHLFVAWSPTSDAVTPFDAYVAERVQLLIDPPEGA